MYNLFHYDRVHCFPLTRGAPLEDGNKKIIGLLIVYSLSSEQMHESMKYTELNASIALSLLWIHVDPLHAQKHAN